MSAADINAILKIIAGNPPPATNSQPAQQFCPAPAHASAPVRDPRLLARTPPSYPTPPPPPQQPPRPDPRAVLDYPSAVRHVTKVISQDAELLSQIARIKSRQHEHERVWWQGRQDIIQRHKARAETGSKVEAVLRSLGAAPTAVTLPSEQEELAAYDRKVHRRCEEMARHMGAELGLLGVPLFCGEYPGLDRVELLEMRRKLLELLEDMCDG